MTATVLEVHTVTLTELGGSAPVEKTQKSGLQIVSHQEQLASQALQLGHLASLHHTSEYSRMKYGPKGSPSTYIPLCIHMPAHFKDLQEQQAIRATQKAWWKTQGAPMEVPMRVVPQGMPNSYREKQPTLSRPASSVDLQRDLLNAMTSPLTSQTRPVPTTLPDCRVKTSETHPINLSAIIPPEVMQLIATHLIRSRENVPVLFEVPPSLCLHTLVVQRSSFPNQLSSNPICAPAPTNLRPIAPTHPRTPFQLSKTPGFVNLLWSQSFWRKAIGSSHPEVPKSSWKSAPTSQFPSAIPGQPTKVLRSPSFTGWKQASKRTASGSLVLGPKVQPSETRQLSKGTSPRVPESSFTADFPLPTPQVHTQPLEIAQDHPGAPLKPDVNVMLGNLLLSSCPGKKVRLDGPMKGRSAVCRDLALDLRRIRGSGVCCIVCCLDDEELGFLGSPWHEYSHIAEEIGLDVLRLPTPEGLAPLDPQTLDSHLTRLIGTYTLKGQNVLVHCRGGVGRAGLIACCWIIKLGLCGWVETEHCHYSPVAPSGTPSSGKAIAGDDEGIVRRDTLQLVERTLSVVRKQRSPKAVETFEQVKFLVDFVDYLRNKKTPNVPSSLISVHKKENSSS